MNSAIRARSVSGVRTNLLGGLFDGQVGGKVAQSAPGLGGGHANLLLGGRTMRALSSSRVALMRASSCSLSCSTSVRNLAISSSSPASLASTALRRALASSVTLRADSMSWRSVSRALAEDLGQQPNQRNADGQHDDAKLMNWKTRPRSPTSGGASWPSTAPPARAESCRFPLLPSWELPGWGALGLGGFRRRRGRSCLGGGRRSLGRDPMRRNRYPSGQNGQKCNSKNASGKTRVHNRIFQREPPAASGRTARTT